MNCIIPRTNKGTQQKYVHAMTNEHGKIFSEPFMNLKHVVDCFIKNITIILFLF